VSRERPRVLLVDDEPRLLDAVRMNLEVEGFEVFEAHDGAEALERIRKVLPDLVVLDVMMPRLDGLEVCRRLRAKSTVPIIMLTARAEEVDKVVGLELGADDYITKPFSLREFRSRVKAALRRSAWAQRNQELADDEPLEVGELRVDFAKRTVRVRGEDVQATYVEFEILRALACNPGRVFTREMLLTRIWGDSAFRDPRTIDVHIRHLREKLEQDAKDPEYLFTVRGVGYRFRDTDG